MTNDDKPQEDAEFPDEEDMAADEVLKEPEALPAPDSSTPPRKGSSGVAWLALFLALIAAAGFGYMVVQDWRARGDAPRSTSTILPRTSTAA